MYFIGEIVFWEFCMKLEIKRCRRDVKSCRRDAESCKLYAPIIRKYFYLDLYYVILKRY